MLICSLLFELQPFSKGHGYIWRRREARNRTTEMMAKRVLHLAAWWCRVL